MTTLTEGVCYAAHYIQIGSARSSWAGIRRLASGALTLEPFAGEKERTVFMSGTIRLYNEVYPLSDSPTEHLSLAELTKVLHNHQQWQINLSQAL